MVPVSVMGHLSRDNFYTWVESYSLSFKYPVKDTQVFVRVTMRTLLNYDVKDLEP